MVFRENKKRDITEIEIEYFMGLFIKDVQKERKLRVDEKTFRLQVFFSASIFPKKKSIFPDLLTTQKNSILVI